jgi:hypothetical protein
MQYELQPIPFAKNETPRSLSRSGRFLLLGQSGLNYRAKLLKLRVDPVCHPVLPFRSLTGSPPFKVASL